MLVNKLILTFWVIILTPIYGQKCKYDKDEIDKITGNRLRVKKVFQRRGRTFWGLSEQNSKKYFHLNFILQGEKGVAMTVNDTLLLRLENKELLNPT